MANIVNHRRNDDAVSPVIGVMLMIVVTVVIAAVVALFATNVVTSTEAAPVVVMDMKATAGEPVDTNTKLVMSTRGGNPLDLTKVKVIASIENGEKGNVYSGLDRDTSVGQFLELGEKLTVYGGNNRDNFEDKNAAIGGGFDRADLKVGDKLKVSVVFNENAILYEKEIIIVDGAHEKEGTIISDENSGWTDSEGNPLDDIKLQVGWTNIKISAAPSLSMRNASANAVAASAKVADPVVRSSTWAVNIANANNESESDTIYVSLSAEAQSAGKQIVGIKVSATEIVTPSHSVTVNDDFILFAVVESVDVPVESVTLNQSSMSIVVGGTGTLTATVLPETATDKNVEWTTSDPSVATVSDGTVTAVATGTATITCTSKSNPTKSATCSVTVTSSVVPVESVTLDQSSLSLTVGGTDTLTATVLPEIATDRSVTWTTSDSSVATVEDGTVTAVAEGSATITCTSNYDETKSASCSVTVSVVPVDSVVLNTAAIALTVGETNTLTVTVLPSTATDKSVSWTTSDSSVATVSNGTVTAVAVGTATITCTSNYDSSKSATCSVTVSSSEVPVESVSLDQNSLTLDEGDISTLTATVLPSTATDKSVTWTTSDESIATVEDGTVTAVAEGSATITCTSNSDSSKYDTCDVTVNSPEPEPGEKNTIHSVPPSIDGETDGDEISIYYHTESGDSGTISYTWSSDDNKWVGDDITIEVTLGVIITFENLYTPDYLSPLYCMGESNPVLIGNGTSINVIGDANINFEYYLTLDDYYLDENGWKNHNDETVSSLAICNENTTMYYEVGDENKSVMLTINDNDQSIVLNGQLLEKEWTINKVTYNGTTISTDSEDPTEITGSGSISVVLNETVLALDDTNLTENGWHDPEEYDKFSLIVIDNDYATMCYEVGDDNRSVTLSIDDGDSKWVLEGNMADEYMVVDKVTYNGTPISTDSEDPTEITGCGTIKLWTKEE